MAWKSETQQCDNNGTAAMAQAAAKALSYLTKSLSMFKNNGALGLKHWKCGMTHLNTTSVCPCADYESYL